jgi:hypothetical protein
MQGATDGLGNSAGVSGDNDDGDVLAGEDAMDLAAICSITATAAGMSSLASKTASKADFQSVKLNRLPKYACK